MADQDYYEVLGVSRDASDEDIKKIAALMLSEIGKRINGLGITISFSDEVTEMLAKEGYDPIYGARPLRRAIQTKIEDEMATEILEGRIKAGDTVQVKVKDKKICFVSQKSQE